MPSVNEGKTRRQNRAAGVNEGKTRRQNRDAEHEPSAKRVNSPAKPGVNEGKPPRQPRSAGCAHPAPQFRIPPLPRAHKRLCRS